MNGYSLELYRYKESFYCVVGVLYLKKPVITASTVYFKRIPLCATLENKSKIIPVGTYELDNDTVSPRFGEVPFYARVCSGKLPRLKNVPHRKGILLHCGNNFTDTSGCILLGRIADSHPWSLTCSKVEFERCYPAIKRCETIKIIDVYHESPISYTRSTAA